MLRPYFPIGVVVVIAALLAFVAYPAFAQQAAPVIAYNSIWFDLWSIVQPVVVLLVSTVGPVLVTWISGRLITWLKVSGDAKKAEVEARLREALHQSAMNALKYAMAKYGVGASAVGPHLISEAVQYVEDKNPEALAKLNVSGDGLRDIIMSKIPDLPDKTATTG